MGPGDWADAYDHGLVVSVAFVLAGLIIALADVGAARRGRRRTEKSDPPQQPRRAR
ncbi:hypothetical protein NKH18_41765 [Streptomyces sp. M10(2022)]